MDGIAIVGMVLGFGMSLGGTIITLMISLKHENKLKEQ